MTDKVIEFTPDFVMDKDEEESIVVMPGIKRLPINAQEQIMMQFMAECLADYAERHEESAKNVFIATLSDEGEVAIWWRVEGDIPVRMAMTRVGAIFTKESLG